MDYSVVMAWFKCQIQLKEVSPATIKPSGNTPWSFDTAFTDPSDIGIIKEKSTTLEAGDGEKLEAYATGHELVAQQTSNGTYALKTRLIEPTYEQLALFGIGENVASGSGATGFSVKTHAVTKKFSLKVTPENVGARGVKIPLAAVTLTPGWSEEEGHYLDLTFDIMMSGAGYWYQLFTKAAA